MGNRRSRPRPRPRRPCPARRIRIRLEDHWWGVCVFCRNKTMVELKIGARRRYCCRPCIRQHCTEYDKINPHLFTSRLCHLH